MLAAIAQGNTRIENFSDGADCASTLECLRALGVEIDHNRQMRAVEVKGRGRMLQEPAIPLPCGNSGSTMRMLSGILAGQKFAAELVGDESLSRRPMQRVILPLRQMGAQVTAATLDRPPLRIQGGRLHGIHYEMPVASAQVKSAILFAALYADGETVVIEPVPTRDHSELALRAFGAQVNTNTRLCSVVGGHPLHALPLFVPGDISSAAYFICAAALFPGSNLIVDRVLLNPTRAAVLDFLMSMGVGISVLQVDQINGELQGTLQVRGGNLRGGLIAGARTAAMIDELPVLAAIAPYTERGIEIRDAGELRVKESDRIDAMAATLRAFGAVVEVFADGLKIVGRQQLHGSVVDSCGDHRIAMAAAIAALRASDHTMIHNAEAASISYPSFFSDLERVVER